MEKCRFLCGTDWIIKYDLDGLRLQTAKILYNNNYKYGVGEIF
jgi:hypothetical protein